MSYDIRFGVKVEGTDIIAVVGEPDADNPTYNLGGMFRACTGWDYEQGVWYKVEDVLPLIEHGIHELEFNREQYEKYDSPNGVGTTFTALKALKSMREGIVDTVTGRCGWNKIPLGHLWVTW